MACETVDLADAASLVRLLDEVQPQVVVNAAAYTAVDRAEQEPELAVAINGEAVGEMGAWAAANDAAVLHFSTDYVFAGQGDRPWREDDVTGPLGQYGRSKLAGEEALLASGCRHIILRTAWVYAARGHNFMLTMLRLAGQRDSLRVVADQFGSPTSAPLIAAGASAVLARWLSQDAEAQAGLSGIYHMTSAGHCSWHEFAEAIIRRGHALDLLPRAIPVEAIGSEEYPTPATRPAWSVLDCDHLAETFGVRLPAWPQGLDLVLDDLAATRRVLTETL